MSRDATMLLTSSSHVATGILFGSLLTLVFNILSARILGPLNFGNLGLIITFGNIFGLSMGLAIYPMIVYASSARDEAEQTTIISTAYILITLLTVASVASYVLISGLLSQVFRISATLLLFSVAYAATYSFFVVTINPLRVFFKMKTYALLNTFQSVVVLGVFLAFISNNIRSWEGATVSLYVSYVVVGLLSVVFLRKYITLRFDRSWSKKIMTYVWVSVPGAVAGVCLGIDRILINVFSSTAQVGIYNAYFVPSMTVSLLLWGIFNAAFLPYASRSRDKGAIFVKITKPVPYVVIVLVPLFVLIERFAFLMYGSQYPFSWELAFFFALAGTTSFFLAAYSSLMQSEGSRGAKVNSNSGIIQFIALALLDVLLIPLIGILGAVITLIVAYSITIFYLVLRRQTLGGSLAEPHTLSGDG
jgi:O-antigen/teichoic acid export membrane protein